MGTPFLGIEVHPETGLHLYGEDRGKDIRKKGQANCMDQN
jgi:hypothetical protein